MKKTHFRKHPKTQNKPTESMKLAAKKRKKEKGLKGFHLFVIPKFNICRLVCEV